jgi:hypothetical protein
MTEPLDAVHDFHRLRGIESCRGRRQRRNEQEYVRWCFASVIDADDFAQQFGGTRLQPRDTRTIATSAALTCYG